MKRRYTRSLKTPRLLQSKRAQTVLSFLFPSVPSCPLCAVPHKKWYASLVRPYICSRCYSSVTELVGPLCRVCGKFVELGGSDTVGLFTDEVAAGVDSNTTRISYSEKAMNSEAVPSVSGVKMDRNGLCEDCNRSPHLFLLARAFARYDGSVEKAIVALKYQGETRLAPVLGEWLAEAYLRHFGWDRTAVLVPVPMHPVKERRRGYNQAQLLATSAAKLLRLKVDNALVRNAEQFSQTIRTRQERLTSLQGSFALSERTTVTGKHIVLVDDVLTTGGTADACSEALIMGGAASVYVLTVAR